MSILRFLFCVAAIVLLYTLLRLHSLPVPLDRDEGVFGYTGQRILEGGKPYADAFDHKPPGVFYIYALALCFLPATPTGIHAFLSVYNFLTLVALTLLIWLRFRSVVACVGGAAAYAVFSASPAIQGFTASTEMLMLLPIVLCVVFAVTAGRTDKPSFIVLSGVFAAVAFWIKQTGATSAAFALAVIIAADWSNRRRRIPRDVALWAIGGAIVSAGIAAYFYFTGLFREFIYWSFTHNLEYAEQLSFSDAAAGVLQSSGEIIRGDFMVVGLGVATAVWCWKKRRSEAFFVLGFMALSLAGTLPGFAYPHYFAQLAPAVALASGWALSVIADSKLPFSRAAAFGLLVAIVTIPVYVHRDYFIYLSPDEISRHYFGENPFPESVELSAFLEGHTTPQDRIFIAGSEPQILLQSHRQSATAFVTMYPLTRQYAHYREFQERLWHDLQTSKPKYILATNIAMSILWDGKASTEIFDRLNDKLLVPDYEMEAVMPIRQPKGHLIPVHNGIPDSEIQTDEPTIFVYRRKN